MLGARPSSSAGRSLLTERDTVDLKTGYQISQHFDVYLNVDNVLNEDDRALKLFGGFPTSIIRISPIFHVGLNARF